MTLLFVATILWFACFPIYRLILWLYPNSALKDAICTGFFLMVFNPVILAPWLPIPFMRLVYVALGAKLGPRTYGGTLLDPWLTTIGSDCLLSRGAILTCHLIVRGHKYQAPIVIGSKVTVGINAIIMPGVVIEDCAVIAAGAVVTKHTYIGRGEHWAGVPAKRIEGVRTV